MRWMNHKKSRVMDFFRRIDKDQDGKITRQEFIDGILASSGLRGDTLLGFICSRRLVLTVVVVVVVCRVPHQQAGDDSRGRHL